MTNPPQGDPQGDGPEAGRSEAPSSGGPGAPQQGGPGFGPPAQPYGQPGQYGQPAFGPPAFGPPGQQPYGQPGQYGQPPFGPPGQYGAPPYGQPQYGQPYAAGSGSAPARKSHLRLYLGLATVGVLMIVAVALANLLGPTILDPAAVERDVAEQFEERHGVAVDLSCDDEMRVEEGASYECDGTTESGEDVTLQITIADEEDAAYTWAEP